MGVRAFAHSPFAIDHSPVFMVTTLGSLDDFAVDIAQLRVQRAVQRQQFLFFTDAAPQSFGIVDGLGPVSYTHLTLPPSDLV